MAFQDFNFKLGLFKSPFNNFANFKQLFAGEMFYRVFANSILLSFSRLIISFPVPIILAIMLNEIKSVASKRFAQTLMYLPHFISWVVLGGIVVNFLSVNDGLFNMLLDKITGKRINFLGSTEWFRALIIGTHIWKGAGWSTIVYLAGLSAINPEFYEAATVDGANRFQKIWHITFPGVKNTIMIMLILAIGGIMGNGFEQIYLFQNPLNLPVSEVFETYTYRIGIVGGRYSFSAAVGLFQSVIAAILVFGSNKIARMLGEASFY